MRSYYKLYTDSINFPTYISAKPVNPTDVAIYMKRLKKDQFIANVNQFLLAHFRSFAPTARNYRLCDSGGVPVAGDVDCSAAAFCGFTRDKYSNHPLD